MKNINFKNIDVIIWDWNGTLLNDVAVSIKSMNQMLLRKNISVLTVEKYKSIFTFPVREYYIKAGIHLDEHNWDKVAMEFISNYRKNIVHAELHSDTFEMLEFFKSKMKKQFILSAMEQNFLEYSVRERGIISYFERVIGLNNHYASSKLKNAKILAEECNFPPEKICMIGDTAHDFEVAGEVGMSCILVSNGHLACDRFSGLNCPLVGNLLEIKDLF